MGKQKAILFDAVLCQGCGACYDACKEVNKLEKTSDDPLKDRLSANTYNALEVHKVKDVNKNDLEVYSRKMCMHCQEPACASVCPIGAFTKTELGPVIYAAEKCIGCRYCMQACPHQTPRYEWNNTNPLVTKCQMCYERVSKGGTTGCAEACPVEATIFGDRDEILKIARQRMQDSPGTYYPEIYGEKEAGGSNVLVISPASFDQLGYASNLPKKGLPGYTEVVMEKVPHIVGIGGVFLTGMYWLTKRKNEIAKEEKSEIKK